MGQRTQGHQGPEPADVASPGGGTFAKTPHADAAEPVAPTRCHAESTTGELRSLNEELSMGNALLRDKVGDLRRAHDALANFFTGTEVAAVFLDRQLRVKRMTPAAKLLLRLETVMVGLPIDAIEEALVVGLAADARMVLKGLGGQTCEVLVPDGRWITRRALPHRTERGRLNGVVVTFTDVTELKVATERLSIRERQQAVIAGLGIDALQEKSLQRFFDHVALEVQQTLDVDFCKLLELQPGSALFYMRAGLGWRAGAQRFVPNDLGSQAGFTLLCREPVVVEDLQTDQRFTASDLLLEHGVRSGLSCVIERADGPYGVVGVHTRGHRTFTREDANFLQAVCSVIGGAVEQSEARIRLALEGATAKALSESSSLYEAIECFHDAAADMLGSGLVQLWEQRPGAPTEFDCTLECPQGDDEDRVELPPAQPVGLQADDDLVRRVALSGRAQWLSLLQETDVVTDAPAPHAPTFVSGLAFPILLGARVVGVVTIASVSRLQAGPGLLQSLEAVGRSMGDFVSRLEGQRRFETTVNSAPLGIFERDLTGRVLRVNDRLCQITGYSEEELVGSSLSLLLQADDVAEEVRMYEEVCTGLVPRHLSEQCCIRKDGSSVWLSLSVALVRKPSGRPDYCVCIAEDITDRRHAEHALLQASRQKDDFLAVLGHELRNPLAAVRNAIQLLQHSQASAPEAALPASVLVTLERQTMHMGKLLDGLLDISRVVRGKITMDKQPVDLRTIVQGVVDDYQPIATKHGHTLRSDLPASEVLVFGDKVRLTQVVDNLLSNAVAHSSRPCAIEVTLAPAGAEAVLRVRDSGDGIDPELLPRLFEPFLQGKQSLDRKHGGLGIGLALVASLVELHDGRVEARSAGRGHGAEFVVGLPLTEVRAQPTPQAGPQLGAVRIVLIEDNEDAAEMLRLVIKRRGHDVAIALRGAEGIALTQSLVPDAVICDLGLPDGDTGHDVARKLRSDPRTCRIPLIALSGYGRAEDQKSALDAGFDVHLTKPVGWQDVERVLRDLKLGASPATPD